MSSRFATDEVGVLTVDDHPGFRAAAAEIIAATPGFASVGEASGGREALEAVERLHPRMVVVDVRMAEMSGPELARRISDDHPEMLIVLVSSDPPEDPASLTRASGAHAFLRKEQFRPAALRSLWAVHGG